MEKQFQEVFPDLRIEGGMAELLDTVEVSRVSINKKKDLLRIYVVSHQWIHKKYISAGAPDRGAALFQRAAAREDY